MNDSNLSPIGRRARASAISIILGLVLACATSNSAAGADCSWTGNINGLWSNPNNWSPVGVPQNGDSLLLEKNSNTSMVNDLAGLVVSGLKFGSDTYRLSGNALILSNAFSILVDGTCCDSLSISCPLVFKKNTTFRTGCTPGQKILRLLGPLVLGNVDLDLSMTASDVEISGEISGTGDLRVS